MRMGGMAHHRGDDRHSQSFGKASSRHHQRGSTVRNRRRVGGGDRAILHERRFQQRYLFRLRLARLLVDSNDHIAATTDDWHWSDFPRERSEEHTSELQSLLRTWYAVFCLTIK